MSRAEYILKQRIERFEKGFKGSPQEKIILLEEALHKAWLEIATLSIKVAALEGDKLFDTKDDFDVKAIGKLISGGKPVDSKFFIKYDDDW